MCVYGVDVEDDMIVFMCGDVDKIVVCVCFYGQVMIGCGKWEFVGDDFFVFGFGFVWGQVDVDYFWFGEIDCCDGDWIKDLFVFCDQFGDYFILGCGFVCQQWFVDDIIDCLDIVYVCVVLVINFDEMIINQVQFYIFDILVIQVGFVVYGDQDFVGFNVLGFVFGVFVFQNGYIVFFCYVFGFVGEVYGDFVFFQLYGDWMCDFFVIEWQDVVRCFDECDFVVQFVESDIQFEIDIVCINDNQFFWFFGEVQCVGGVDYFVVKWQEGQFDFN